MSHLYFLYAAFFLLAAYIGFRIWVRLELSQAKHPSLRGHSKWSRRIAKQVPFFDYIDEQFFNSDGAPAEVVEQRKTALGLSKFL